MKTYWVKNAGVSSVCHTWPYFITTEENLFKARILRTAVYECIFESISRKHEERKNKHLQNFEEKKNRNCFSRLNLLEGLAKRFLRLFFPALFKLPHHV